MKVKLALKTGQLGEACHLSIALQNSPSSGNTRRACSLMSSVSASYWLSGKQTPSSVLCVQSKSFPNLSRVLIPTLHSNMSGLSPVLPMKLWGPDSASRFNLRVTSGVVMCQCGLYIPSHVSVPHPDFVSLLSESIYSP